MRDYEMMIILDPSVDERNLSTNVDKLLQVVPNEGGSLEKVDIWGKRRLAYDIQKHSEGTYVVVNMKATPETGSILRGSDSIFHPLSARSRYLEDGV